MTADRAALIEQIAEAIWDTSHSGTISKARAVLAVVEPLLAERDALAAQVRREVAEELRAESRRIRAAWREHNQGRDLSKKPDRRPDLRHWADGIECMANRITRDAREEA